MNSINRLIYIITLSLIIGIYIIDNIYINFKKLLIYIFLKLSLRTQTGPDLSL